MEKSAVWLILTLSASYLSTVAELGRKQQSKGEGGMTLQKMTVGPEEARRIFV